MLQGCLVDGEKTEGRDTAGRGTAGQDSAGRETAGQDSAGEETAEPRCDMSCSVMYQSHYSYFPYQRTLSQQDNKQVGKDERFFISEIFLIERTN